jgi:hypothetical protein
VQLSHVEVSVPVGTLTQQCCDDLDRLFSAVFGWTGSTTVATNPFSASAGKRHTYRLHNGQSLVVFEDAEFLRAGAEDHIGVALDRAEFDRVFAGCTDLARRDDRVELRYVHNGAPSVVEMPGRVLRTFFVRLLVPLWIQFECWETVAP